MNTKREKVRIGTFMVGDTATIGHVTTDGKDTTVRLYSNDFYHFRKQDEARIHGTLTNHEKITLVDCVTSTVPGTTTTPNGQSHHANVFPHYIVTGSHHIEPEELDIGAIELHIANVHSLFWDYTAFGSTIGDREANKSFIAQVTAGMEKPPEIGAYPDILYFTGKYQILTAQTALGHIVVSHRPRFTSPTPRGLRVKNYIVVRIEFVEPSNFHDAFLRAQELLVFLDLMMGTKHGIKTATIELATKSDEKPRLDVYQTMASRRSGKKNSSKPHPGDVLINGGLAPDSFARVLTAWVGRQAEWKSARFRFIQNFRKDNNYTIDRLVAAANVFDLLPAAAVGGAPAISASLAKATAEAKKLFRELPPSQERESVLGALGRVGNQTLRSKVAHRAKLVTNRFGNRFPDLDLVVAAAISTRNYFVHGSEGKLSHEACFEFAPFFTDTLEFIFGASDLIEAGWDAEKWNKAGTTLSHPFGRFRTSYVENLANLKAKLAPNAP